MHRIVIATLAGALLAPAALAPAAQARKPTLTTSRAESALTSYVRRAYPSRASGRSLYPDCRRITRTFQDCTYWLSFTSREATECGFAEGAGRFVPPWCGRLRILDAGRYNGTGTVRLISGRVLARASYPR